VARRKKERAAGSVVGRTAKTVGGIAIKKGRRVSRTTAGSVGQDIKQQKSDPGLSEFLPPPIKRRKKRK
jgi:hypothetical protein